MKEIWKYELENGLMRLPMGARLLDCSGSAGNYLRLVCG
jgi:hypothetical protein